MHPSVAEEILKEPSETLNATWQEWVFHDFFLMCLTHYCSITTIAKASWNSVRNNFSYIVIPQPLLPSCVLLHITTVNKSGLLVLQMAKLQTHNCHLCKYMQIMFPLKWHNNDVTYTVNHKPSTVFVVSVKSSGNTSTKCGPFFTVSKKTFAHCTIWRPCFRCMLIAPCL
jgi:hypothetical protein